MKIIFTGLNICVTLRSREKYCAKGKHLRFFFFFIFFFERKNHRNTVKRRKFVRENILYLILYRNIYY